MNALLTLDHLSVDYHRRGGPVHAVRDVSMAINQGETLAIVGESGCGKSTAALAILGLITPAEGWITQGEITFNGTALQTLSPRAWQQVRGSAITMIFQDPYTSFNPVMTIGAQLHEALIVHQPALAPQQARTRVNEVLADVRLLDTARIAGAYPHQLSGGQLQRCAIARAIINRPSLLIADEPTTALDVTIQREIMDLLDTLKTEHHLTVIFITHNLPLAHERAQRIAVMYAGEIVECADTQTIFTAPRHPYTQALINAAPSLHAVRGTPRTVLAGQPPDLASVAQGCSFAPRCPCVMALCRSSHPVLETVGTSRIRCYLYTHGSGT